MYLISIMYLLSLVDLLSVETILSVLYDKTLDLSMLKAFADY